MNKYIFFVAHPDDETLGCGGTIKNLTTKKAKVKVFFFTRGEGSRDFDNIELKNKEIERIAQCKKALKELGVKDFVFNDYPDNQLYKADFLNMVKNIETEIKKFKPNYIFTHYYGDLNIDHRIISRAVTTAARPAHNPNILGLYFFPTLSSTEWNYAQEEKFHGNYFVDISKSLNSKIKAFNYYKSEKKKNYPRSQKAIKSLAIINGSHIGCEFAEAFKVGFIKKS